MVGGRDGWREGREGGREGGIGMREDKSYRLVDQTMTYMQKSVATINIFDSEVHSCRCNSNFIDL